MKPTDGDELELSQINIDGKHVGVEALAGEISAVDLSFQAV